MKKPRLKSQSVEFRTEHPLAHQLPYWDFADDALVLVDGSLVMAADLHGVSIETKDASQINQAASDLRALLNSIPDGTELSFTHALEPASPQVIEAHQDYRSTSSEIDWLTDLRADALQQEIQKEALLKPNLRIAVYRRNPAHQRKKQSFFATPQNFLAVKRAEYETGVTELRQTFGSILASLASCGIESTRLDAPEMAGAIRGFLCPQLGVSGEAFPNPLPTSCHRQQEFTAGELARYPELAIASPRQQMLYSDLICRYDSIFYDGFFHRCITLKALPEFTHAAMISQLSALSFAHTLSLHIKVPDQSRELAALHVKRRMAHALSASHEGRPTDLESEAKLSSTEDLLRDLINTGQKLFYFDCIVHIRARTQDELESKTRECLRKFREFNGAEALAETVATFKVWKSILPMGNLTMVRPKRIKTDNLADFLPVYQPYEGASKPICLFKNRERGLVSMDPFDATLPNYNALVTGSSGAGKSFVANQLLLQFLSQNPVLSIIDVGGSYRKLCEFARGEYIDLAPSTSESITSAINPFELPAGATVPSARKIKFLLAMLEMMLADGATLSKLDRSLLEEQIISLYQDTPNPRLSDLVLRLKSSSNKTLHQYATMLFPWTGSRPYGQLLDVQSGLSTRNPVIVFDLKGLSTYPDLQSVMLLIVTDYILGRIDTFTDRRKIILMDECWELLKSPASQNFMEYCVRTLRKTGSGITFVTQGLEEIVASPIGAAILSNTATKFVLMQRGDLAPVQKFLKLTDQQMAVIASLQQSKGSFSEAFLLKNSESAVLRIEPTPQEYWLATSDAADNTQLAQYRLANPDKPLRDLIDDLANQYPTGVSGAKND